MNNLDNLVKEHGVTELNENNIKYADKNKILEDINNTFAYEDRSYVIPGEDIEYKINDQINSINKQNAMESLITQAALLKAKKESNKLTKEQKEQLKKQFVESMLYQQGELYYQKYHYLMDGKTKRRIRKKIEREYDKQKFTKSGVYFEQPKVKQVPVSKKQTDEKKEPVNFVDL